MTFWLFACLIQMDALGQTIICPARGAYPMPEISDAVRNRFEEQLQKAEEDLRLSPDDADGLVWVGRRLAYLGRYHDAIDIFSRGVVKYPQDARFLRHRGHRRITLRCLEEAVDDLKGAARLVRGKADEVEPDGLPNARNIPTSTLQSNIWYHLGLAYFLQGNYRKALSAYKSCLRVSDNNDMFVATANWYHLTLLKLGRRNAARKFLSTIDTGMTLIENDEYLAILGLHIERPDPARAIEFLKERKDLSLVSYGYGLGEYLLERGDRQGAREVFSLIVSAKSNWSAFGYMAAERALQGLH